MPYTIKEWCYRLKPAYRNNPRKTMPINLTKIALLASEDALSFCELLLNYDDEKYKACNTSTTKFIQISRHNFFRKHKYLDWDKMLQKMTKGSKVLRPPFSPDEIYDIIDRHWKTMCKKRGSGTDRCCNNFERRVLGNCTASNIFYEYEK